MIWIGLSPAELCEAVKSKRENGGKDFEALTKHVSEDSLVLWGWHPGGDPGTGAGAARRAGGPVQAVGCRPCPG